MFSGILCHNQMQSMEQTLHKYVCNLAVAQFWINGMVKTQTINDSPDVWYKHMLVTACNQSSYLTSA